MSLRRVFSGLRMRILLSVVIAALVVVGPVMLFMLGKFGQAHINAQLAASRLLSEPERAACRQSPATFHLERLNLSIHAYDRETLRSANPAAPPLEPKLVARLRRGERAPWIHIPRRRSETIGVALTVVGERGPCSVLRIELLRFPTVSSRLRSVWIGGTTVALAIAMLIAMFVAIRPLVRRLRRLRSAAQRVGGADFEPPVDRHADDISAITAALAAAHRRIVADTRELTEQREVLAEHLAHIAHDLRTPIASLQLALEGSLRDDEPEPDRRAETGFEREVAAEGLGLDAAGSDRRTEGRREALRRAWDDAIYLSSLVENLHLASQLRGGADPYDARARTDVSDVIAQVGRRFAALGAMREVDVSWSTPERPLWVRCDPAMAQQAFANLVHNAVVHGDVMGHVAVLLEVEGDEFVLRVVDDGPGVPPESLPTLNEPTFRSDAARRRDPRGGGLGIAITHEICRRGGWSLAFGAADPRGLDARIRGPLIKNDE
ncbi:MAG: HAMP domain-containing histidine kinase [Myxococcales bacterium]|nr:HAMP domain-containing histidine kinase [Myxococcales bacterium]